MDESSDPTMSVSCLRGRLEDKSAHVVVVGQGYVGLPVAVRAAEVGFRVTGFDVDATRIELLRAGRSYVEDIGATRLRDLRDGAYEPTDDPAALRGFDVAVISVPTPLREGTPDLSHVESAAATLAAALTPGALVVLESTTYPGTTEELVLPILERSGLRAGVDFALGYSPERIDPGNVTWTLETTPKVVSGIDDASLRAVAAFYGTLVEQVVPVGSTAEAELVKLLENTFRHVNIALVNELAMFARRPGRQCLERDRRRVHQAVRLHALHPGAGRGRPLPAGRSLVSVMAGAPSVGPSVPLRRAGQ